MASNLFADAILKVKRAYRHIDEVIGCLSQDASDSGSYRLSVHDNSTIQLEVLRPIRPAYALCIGDAVHNFRSALDFVAASLLRRAGEEPANVNFPFHETRENLVDSLKKAPIKKAGADICTIILDVIKPYKAGNYPLWALNKLDNLDKHCLLMPVLFATAVVGVCAKSSHGAAVENCTLAATGPGLYRMIQLGGQVEITNHGKPAFDVLFPEGALFGQQSVVPTLHQLGELVIGVVNTFGAHCASKGG